MMVVLPNLDREIRKRDDDCERSDDFTDGANGISVRFSLSR
jgi:hypothetical protein